MSLLPTTFYKYHGIGNDFVVIDSRHCRAITLTPALIQRLCDRHFGIGADGILVISNCDQADARMVVYNSDGSRAEMCGNGLRCVALYVVSPPTDGCRNVLPHVNRTVRIATDDGTKRCHVTVEPTDRTSLVQIDMGRATTPQAVTANVNDEPVQGYFTSMGNPHLVVFEPRVRFDDAAKSLSQNTLFPNQANVSFVTARNEPGHFDAVVWERGVGRTLACGTAACAVAACCVHNGLAESNTSITIHLPGGALQITVSRELHITMTGPAAFVYEGTICFDQQFSPVPA